MAAVQARLRVPRISPDGAIPVPAHGRFHQIVLEKVPPGVHLLIHDHPLMELPSGEVVLDFREIFRRIELKDRAYLSQPPGSRVASQALTAGEMTLLVNNGLDGYGVEWWLHATAAQTDSFHCGRCDLRVARSPVS